MGKNGAVTPMMEQYHRMKREHPDALLFFRLGDFYEMFYEDARRASPVLEIALTSRQKVPMCGVPYHAVDTYLVKLLKHGFKVAICEQIEDPKQARGVVKREVMKVLTPGTALEVNLTEGRESTYIAGLAPEKDGWGLAVMDLAAGEIRASQSEGEGGRRLEDELFKLSPREIVYPAGQEEYVQRVLKSGDFTGPLLSPQEEWIFETGQAGSVLKEHFGVTSLAGFDLSGRDLAVSAAGALLHYLKGLRRDSLDMIRRLSYIQAGIHMILDTVSVRNLELIRNLRDNRRSGSLLDVIDHTVGPMGSRLMKSWLLQPLLDGAAISVRQDAVAELLDASILRQELRDGLRDVHDIERLSGKVALAVAHARDLVALKKSLEPLPRIRDTIRDCRADALAEIHRSWDNADDIRDLIDKAVREEPALHLTEGGIIRDGYHDELDELRGISRSGKGVITDIERKERERTGITSLKIRYNKVFGYYIDVTRPNLHLVPEEYIRKQTLVNSERFITGELKQYEEKVLNAETRIGELEYRLFMEIRDRVAEQVPRLQGIASCLAQLDVLAGLAELAAQQRYVRPLVDESDRIRIVGGRHPVIEVTHGEPFIPNDSHLDCDEDQILIITGPNMGGKSTFLRQVALICILAQIGSFVPAEEAEIGAVDRIFTRIGAMDFLSVGQSTFMVEMLETANILNNATPRSLILLDEVGRGTSTFDGLSLAWAIAEYLHQREGLRPKTLFATHYHELTELALTMERIKNSHVTVKERSGEITFLRKIVSGPSDQSYGIHVAKLAGIPRDVIVRAREILFNLEKKELDAKGRPRIAYREANDAGAGQGWLFPDDREMEILRDLKRRLQDLRIETLTPLEALNRLEELKRTLDEN